jgi:RNA-directed DNA polymerase
VGKRARRLLFERLCGDTAALNRAWRALNKANRRSAGIQGQTIEQFEQGRLGNLRSIAAELRSGAYCFSPVKGVPVPKGGGKSRPIRVQEVKDRIVGKAIAGLIAPHLTRKLHLDHPSSFGYRPNLGVRDALHRMLELFDEGRSHLFEADIVSFFDSIDRDRLLNTIVFPNLPDSSLCGLIRAALDQEVGNLDDLPTDLQELFQDSGVAQGSALSPLFANAYLASLDTKLEREGLPMIRYADDFIVMCKDRNEAAEAQRLTREVMADLGLELHPTKTRTCRVSEGFSFLGVFFNGVRLIPELKKQKRFKERIVQLTEISNAPQQSLLEVLARSRRFMDGWAAAFCHTDVKHVAPELEHHVDHRLGVAIAKLGWRTGREDTLTAAQRQRSGVPTLLGAVDAQRERWLPKYAQFRRYWSS